MVVFMMTSTPKNADRIAAALFYGVSSLLVVFVNKIVLSNFGFPSFLFLAMMQFLSSCLALGVLSLMHRVDIPRLSCSVLFEVMPISAMFLGNVVSGLGSTQALNLPMFTALRRFSILMTMVGEYLVLGSVPTRTVALSVLMMVGGSLVAALYDLQFNARGYVLILLNDLFTALNGVYLKKASSSVKVGKMAVLFYNSAFSGIALLLFFIWSQIFEYQAAASGGPPAADSELSRVLAFEGWREPRFVICFCLAAVMGSVLNYSIFLCTSINSALTTAVVGCLKNVMTTYFSMIFLPGYTFTALNFIGLNVSIVGSLVYTYAVIYLGMQGFGG
jgi:solute carrier family 35 protein